MPRYPHDRFRPAAEPPRSLAEELRGAVRWQLALNFLILAFCVQLVACAGRRLERPKVGTVERGMASWYGDKFHGRPTASGEVYDMHGLTAAHRELPLGTRVAVRNLDNGREVTVRINDRGPFIRGRILDLSYGAAKKLGMVRAGLARVEIRVLGVGEGPPGPLLTTGYAVQVGAFRDRDNALALRDRLTGRYQEVQILTAEGWHRVWVGRFRDRAEAENLRRELARQGFRAVLVAWS
jgi:rare lipoprotein A